MQILHSKVDECIELWWWCLIKECWSYWLQQLELYSEGMDDMFAQLIVKYLCLINMIGLYFVTIMYTCSNLFKRLHSAL